MAQPDSFQPSEYSDTTAAVHRPAGTDQSLFQRVMECADHTWKDILTGRATPATYSENPLDLAVAGVVMVDGKVVLPFLAIDKEPPCSSQLPLKGQAELRGNKPAATPRESSDDNFAVAGNANTPVEMQTRLTEDKDPVVRQVLASHSNRVEILTKLATDDNLDVRRAVAFNCNTPAGVLTKLAEDKDQRVWFGVLCNHNTRAEDKDLINRKLFAAHKAGADDQMKLADDKHLGIRELLASDRNTRAEVLAKLAKDESPDVRRCVARNDSTPVGVLRAHSSSAFRSKFLNFRTSE